MIRKQKAEYAQNSVTNLFLVKNCRWIWWDTLLEGINKQNSVDHIVLGFKTEVLDSATRARWWLQLILK